MVCDTRAEGCHLKSCGLCGLTPAIHIHFAAAFFITATIM